MRRFNIPILTAVALVLSCARLAYGDSINPPNAPFALPAIFQGVTICADCPGIRVTVTLAADGTYKLSRDYLERPVKSDETGKWEYDQSKSIVTLHPSGTNARPQLFSLDLKPSLHMLDAEGNPIPSGPTNSLAEMSPSSAPLEGTQWHVVKLGSAAYSPGAGEQVATLQFDATSMRVSGSSGCNRFTGGYHTSASHELHIGPLGMTRMMCASPAMQAEGVFTKALAQAASFSIEGKTLTLYDKDGTVLVQLEANT